MNFPSEIFRNRTDDQGNWLAWDTASIHEVIKNSQQDRTLRSTERALQASGLLPPPVKIADLKDEYDRSPNALVVNSIEAEAKRKRFTSLVIQLHHDKRAGIILFANDGRLGRRWLYLKSDTDDNELITAIQASAKGSHDLSLGGGKLVRFGTVAYSPSSETGTLSSNNLPRKSADHLTHLDRLEAESMHIIREVMAQSENPVMLYSIGKDSAVMLHLAVKAFYPSPPPFPLLHVDTRWKFQAMYQFRDYIAKESGMDLLVHVNPEGVAKNVNPFDHGSALHTHIMKTEGLKQALEKYKFDVAFGGARRDEEKSRAKERVFSFRTPTHRWDPKRQRPELWNLYNGYKSPGESIRVFPLSNWTELDIWQYIYREEIPIVPLYFAAERPVVERDGLLILLDDDRMQLFPDEKVQIKRVRFRTLGCYPLTGAIESSADDLSSIVLELLQNRVSERQGRAIDTDSTDSMEMKKQEGYF
jgi:sulfate adenylyltransferase subunit 2